MQGTKSLSNARYQRLKQKLNLEELTDEMKKWAELELQRTRDDYDSELDDFSDEDTMSNSVGSGSGSSSPVNSIAKQNRSSSPVEDFVNGGITGKRASRDSTLMGRDSLKANAASGSIAGSNSGSVRNENHFKARTVDNRLHHRGVIVAPPLTVR
jgi:hypothetical protein